MKILAVIPARGGSKGVAKKNLCRLNNRPLIAYIIESAQKSCYIDRLILSTDDQDIADTGASLGVDVPFIRPAHLSADNVPIYSVVRHAYNYFKDNGASYNAVVSLQPTSPFTQTETIDKVISLWRDSKCDSVATVTEITKAHPYIAKRLTQNSNMMDFCSIPKGAVVAPRQKREKAYFLTGGVYLRDKRLLESEDNEGHCLGRYSKAVVVGEIEAVDINKDIDLKFSEFLLSEGY